MASHNTDIEALAAVLGQASETAKEVSMTIAEQLEEKGRKEGRLEGHQEGRLEGREEGRVEGRQAGRRETLLRLIEIRFGPASGETKQHIERASAAEIERWTERILTAPSLSDLFTP